MHTHTIYIDRGHIFYLKNQPVMPKTLLPLKHAMQYGPWQVDMKPISNPSRPSTSWHDVWKGCFHVTLPKDKYHIAPPQHTMPFIQNTSLARFWTNHKVPHFLRKNTPVIVKDQQICHEFLTGRHMHTPQKPKAWLQITLSLSE